MKSTLALNWFYCQTYMFPFVWTSLSFTGIYKQTEIKDVYLERNVLYYRGMLTYILCLNDSYSGAGKGKSIKLLPLTFCTARVSLQNKTTKHPSTIKSFVAKLCIFYDNSWQENKQLLKFSKKEIHICWYVE